MSALENLLAEVRVEAEVAVRTEYENTVVKLRAENEDLLREIESLEAQADEMDARYIELDTQHSWLIGALHNLLAQA